MLEGATLGMCLLCLSRLVLFGERKKLSMTISAILVLFTWLNLGQVLMSAHPTLEKFFIASIPSIFYLMLPLIYFYQQLLVGNQIIWHKRQVLLHIVPTLVATLLSLLLFIMPRADFDAMFFTQSNGSAWIMVNALFFGVLFIAWIGISIAYIVNMVSVSKRYHQKLSYSFSNFSGKTLNWFAWFVGLVCFTWLYSLAVLLAEDAIAEFYIHSSGVGFLVLLIVWFFSLHSIQQKPVFIAEQIEETPEPKDPYTKSALDDERLHRIADKITLAIKANKLYLNPDLTAAELAEHLGISAHYLSQAFTQQLNTSFYGFVNECRIADAKQQLVDSDDTVLDIALRVGFNSRSAFYNAFKRDTGITPSAFRQQG